MGKRGRPDDASAHSAGAAGSGGDSGGDAASLLAHVQARRRGAIT